MRISFTLFNQQGVNAITDQQARLVHTQMQLATQKRVLTPSEDPVSSTQIASFKNDIAQFVRYKVNAESALGFNELEDTLLSQTQDLMQRMRELVLLGGNGNYGKAEREALAQEAEVRLKELIGIANTKNAAGEYVFAGFKTDTLPFTLNPAGGALYDGDQGQRQLNTSSSVTVAVSDSGYEVFQHIPNGNGEFTVAPSTAPPNTGTGVLGPTTVTNRSLLTGQNYSITFTTSAAVPPVVTFDVLNTTTGAPVSNGNAYVENAPISFDGLNLSIEGIPANGDSFTISPSTSQDVFTTIQNAISALREPNTTLMRNSLNQALLSIDQAMINFDQVRSEVGARLNIIDAEIAHNASVQLQSKTTLSALEDLDAVEAISRLQQQTTALDAAQRSFSAIQNLSLFRFL